MTGAPRKPVILVVDDDEFQLKIIEIILGHDRYQLHLLTDAIHALQWLRTQRADLVLVDIQMSEVSGLDMTRKLKASPELAHIPVLMMSGQGENLLGLQCLDAGAQDFVVKPFDRVGLQTKVAQLLAAHVATPAAGADPAHPGINVARGLSVWGSLDDYRLFLRKFAAMYVDGVGRLRDCHAQHDFATARSLAHKLRGAAGTMALDDVAYCAGAVEMLAPGHDPAPALAQLQKALDIAIASIAVFAGTTPD